MSFLSHVAYTPKEKHNKENEVGMVLYSIFPGSFITRSSGYYSLRVFFHCSTMYKNTRCFHKTILRCLLLLHFSNLCDSDRHGD